MMRRWLEIYVLSLCLSMTVAMAGCDDFLDKLPDDRAEIDDVDKITRLLVSAYPNKSNALLLEQSSDNVADNGSLYSAQLWQYQAYFFQDVEADVYDGPKSLWEEYYRAVAVANEALQDIVLLNMPDELRGQKAEALLCRAYSMFQLANTFCMAYNPDYADGDDAYPGLPYPKEVESGLNREYDRGTLGELFRSIDSDIEEALPLLDDGHLTVQKYHFNKKAAYAFAARFNLYYMKWDKAIEYATMAIGEDPSLILRPLKDYTMLAGSEDISNQYIQSSAQCNLMLANSISLAGRVPWSSAFTRFASNYEICAYETTWARSPFCPGGSSSSDNCLYWASLQYGSERSVNFPKISEWFEYSDKVSGIGHPHVVDAVFTADETLLVRAEAEIHARRYEDAVRDFNYWAESHCTAKSGTAVRPVFTTESVNSFFNGIRYSETVPVKSGQRTIRKVLNPQGFTVEKGIQENMIQLVLYMRRLETLLQGMRFIDLKRYGISFAHIVDEQGYVLFEPGDLRGAIQLPSVAVQAGITPNPRL